MSAIALKQCVLLSAHLCCRQHASSVFPPWGSPLLVGGGSISEGTRHGAAFLKLTRQDKDGSYYKILFSKWKEESAFLLLNMPPAIGQGARAPRCEGVMITLFTENVCHVALIVRELFVLHVSRPALALSI